MARSTATVGGVPVAVWTGSGGTGPDQQEMVIGFPDQAGGIASETGNVTTNATTVGGSADIGYAGMVTVTVTGTYAGVALAFEASSDAGSHWAPVAMVREDVGIAETAPVMPTNGVQMWSMAAPAINRFRVRSTAYTSGTAAVVIAYGPQLTETNVATSMERSSSAAVSSVTAANADTALLPSNGSRKGATIFNDTQTLMYLKFGTGASATSYTEQVPAQTAWYLPQSPVFLGQINAYWSVGVSGAARVTELT